MYSFYSIQKPAAGFLTKARVEVQVSRKKFEGNFLGFGVILIIF